ncbi:hypothetical protein I4F81_012330 [Pyropia yezoensis]|uniref:Uncharacterized protein n=1 Tax=Pyropia yezoensis TaxID=2788 RepID=A0ACC3CI23_PYRYE|nr:hypothetical protein I4F81_012330 [Neopyropia yezoensis]
MDPAAVMDAKAKPPGSLGLLEDWAARLATLAAPAPPRVTAPAAAIFCASHGVAAARPAVSAYPAAVTAAVVAALAAGGGAAPVIGRSVGVPRERLAVVDVGVSWPPAGGKAEGAGTPGGRGLPSPSSPPPLPRRPPGLAPGEPVLPGGTADFTAGPAMDAATVAAAEAVGAATVRRLVATHGSTVVALGEVGIGNTTAAAAVLAALTGAPPRAVVGRGTGVDDAGLAAKAAAVADGLARHAGAVAAAAAAPRGVLAAVGGVEVAALVGAIHQAARQRVAVLVDGAIVSVAALVAVRLEPAAAGCLFLATRSAEAGHGACVAALADTIWGAGGAPPHGAPAAALAMGLRLGEATGALLAVPLLRAAAAVYTEMATLDEVLAAAEGGGDEEESVAK